jgi:hypothetical protein
MDLTLVLLTVSVGCAIAIVYLFTEFMKASETLDALKLKYEESAPKLSAGLEAANGRLAASEARLTSSAAALQTQLADYAAANTAAGAETVQAQEVVNKQVADALLGAATLSSKVEVLESGLIQETTGRTELAKESVLRQDALDSGVKLLKAGLETVQAKAGELQNRAAAFDKRFLYDSNASDGSSPVRYCESDSNGNTVNCRTFSFMGADGASTTVPVMAPASSATAVA